MSQILPFRPSSNAPSAGSTAGVPSENLSKVQQDPSYTSEQNSSKIVSIANYLPDTPNYETCSYMDINTETHREEVFSNPNVLMYEY